MKLSSSPYPQSIGHKSLIDAPAFADATGILTVDRFRATCGDPGSLPDVHHRNEGATFHDTTFQERQESGRLLPLFFSSVRSGDIPHSVPMNNTLVHFAQDALTPTPLHVLTFSAPLLPFPPARPKMTGLRRFMQLGRAREGIVLVGDPGRVLAAAGRCNRQEPQHRIVRGSAAMTTQRKIEANRRNAQKSTGPRTARGRTRSSSTPEAWPDRPDRGPAARGCRGLRTAAGELDPQSSTEFRGHSPRWAGLPAARTGSWRRTTERGQGNVGIHGTTEGTEHTESSTRRVPKEGGSSEARDRRAQGRAGPGCVPRGGVSFLTAPAVRFDS